MPYYFFNIDLYCGTAVSRIIWTNFSDNINDEMRWLIQTNSHSFIYWFINLMALLVDLFHLAFFSFDSYRKKCYENFTVFSKWKIIYLYFIKEIFNVHIEYILKIICYIKIILGLIKYFHNGKWFKLINDFISLIKWPN